MFRAEAVQHHVQGVQEGDILRYDYTWTKLAYPLVVVACLVGFAFISVFGVDEWAMGPAVVRLEGRRSVTATVPSTVETIDVKPGQWVEINAIVAQMYRVDEEKEFASAQKEFDLALVRVLRDPNDQEAKVQLSSLRARRDGAKTVLDSRTMRAPIAGNVVDIRAQVGGRLNPGDAVLTIAPKGELQATVIAMVPADYGPMLTVGQSMRFELKGFDYVYTDLDVDEVSTGAIGPQEVQRILGQDKAGTVAPEQGAKVLVSGKLPAANFNMEGQSFSYSDGLIGNAQIRVRREPILVLLIPALRSLL
jgi:membrane fusion protein (multidrug efflux system)